MSMNPTLDALTVDAPTVDAPTLVGPGAQRGEPADPRIGALFGNFRVVRKLGEGGMGVVYEAEHQKIGRRAAIKLLHHHLADSEQYAQRFLNEARAVNIIRHRGLVEIFEYGKLPDGTLYFVMEYLEGETLRRRMTKRGAPLALTEAVGIALQMARALAATHAKGITHRDLKPENVMLVQDPVNPGLDWVKILDFGIAKVRYTEAPSLSPEIADMKTRVGSFMGTPRYMAPEQHGQAERVDGKADVFALAVILYEMLAARLPFEDSALTLYERAPLPLDKLNRAVPQRLAKLVQRMMAVRPAARPTMAAVAQALVAFLPAEPARYRRAVAVLLGAAVGLLSVVLIGGLLRGRLPIRAAMKARALAVLKTSLRDPDASVRELAVRALGQSRDLDQRAVLEPLIRDLHQPAQVTEEAARALGKVGAIDAHPALLELLQRHPDRGVQVAAAGALAQLQHPQGPEALRRLLLTDDISPAAIRHKLQAALLLLDRGDTSGAALLWAGIERGALAEKARVQALGRLALCGDARAQQLLSDSLTDERATTGEGRIYAAFSLARLGQEAGWSHLRQAAGGSGPARLLAQRLLASLGEPLEAEPLRKLATARSQPDAARELAIATLADSGREDSLPLLSTVVEDRAASVRLRIAAAGATLQLQAGERSQAAEQSLSWAVAALNSDSVAARELAVAALADLNTEPMMEQTIAPLGQALKDHERTIRTSAAAALGRKTARTALPVLATALDDAEPEVRTAGMQSIGKVVTALKARGDGGAGRLVLPRLRRQAAQEHPQDRVVASGVLMQLGDSSQRETLRSGLGAEEPRVRQLALELGEPDRDLFMKGLGDSDAAVRLAAAQRLVAAGSAPEQAVAVLRQVAARGDSAGLQAYGLLRQMGVSVPPPPGLSSLLSRGDLPTRFAVMQVLPQLPPPPDEALRLLQIGLLDPAAVVRRRAAEVAAEYYRQTGEPRFLQKVRSLLNDPDVIVRARVAALAAELAAIQLPARRPDETPPESAASRATEPAEESAVAPDAPSEPPPSVPTHGTLLLEGDEEIRVRIDSGQPQLLGTKPLPLPPGRHRISYLGGFRDVQLRPGHTVRVKVPVTLVEQCLQDGRDALVRGELDRAQEYFGRARRLLQRGKGSDTLRAELAYQQATLYEARGLLREALGEYNRCLSVPADERSAEVNKGLHAALSRLSAKAGRIQIFTNVGGACQMTQEVLLLPGEQIIGVGQGRTRTVFAQVGSTNRVMACQ